MKPDAPQDVIHMRSKLWSHTLYFHDKPAADEKCAEWIRCNKDGVFEYKVMEVPEPEPELKRGYRLEGCQDVR